MTSFSYDLKELLFSSSHLVLILQLYYLIGLVIKLRKFKHKVVTFATCICILLSIFIIIILPSKIGDTVSGLMWLGYSYIVTLIVILFNYIISHLHLKDEYSNDRVSEYRGSNSTTDSIPDRLTGRSD